MIPILKVGTIVRIKKYPFTDQAGFKTAPVVVLSSLKYHNEREELIGARITSKLVHKDTFGTVEIPDHDACGLTEPSVIKPVVMTVLISQIQRVVGTLDDDTLKLLKRVLSKDVFSGLLVREG